MKNINDILIKDTKLIGSNNVRLNNLLKEYNILTIEDFINVYNSKVLNNELDIVYFNMYAFISLFKFKYLNIINVDLIKFLDIKLKKPSWSHKHINSRFNYFILSCLGLSMSDAMFINRLYKEYNEYSLIDFFKCILKNKVVEPFNKKDSIINIISILIDYYDSYKKNICVIYDGELLKKLVK